MINIAVADDNENDAVSARDMIRGITKELHVSADVDYYLNAAGIENKLLNKKEPLDILILDIDMPEMSGLELAEELRKNNLNLIIIFLSNHEEFVFKAIEFQPFRYIRKMKMNIELPLAIKAAAKIIEMQKDKQVIFNSDDGEIKVMISEIMYFETEKRKIAVHLNNGAKLMVNRTISDIQQMIGSEKFIMIHRSCVVNADYISNMQNCIVYLKNKEQLLVSRRKFREIKQQVLVLWGESI